MPLTKIGLTKARHRNPNIAPAANDNGIASLDTVSKLIDRSWAAATTMHTPGIANHPIPIHSPTYRVAHQADSKPYASLAALCAKAASVTVSTAIQITQCAALFAIAPLSFSFMFI